MAEPASGAAGAASVAAAGWKLVGGAAGIAAGGAGLAAIVVMLMMRPRSAREWAVGLISTVVGSTAGGAAVIQHYSMHSWMDSYVGLVGVLGIVFACGLPAWAIVRWAFTWIERRKKLDLGEVLDDVRGVLGREKP